MIGGEGHIVEIGWHFKIWWLMIGNCVCVKMRAYSDSASITAAQFITGGWCGCWGEYAVAQRTPSWLSVLVAAEMQRRSRRSSRRTCAPARTSSPMGKLNAIRFNIFSDGIMTSWFHDNELEYQVESLLQTEWDRLHALCSEPQCWVCSVRNVYSLFS